MPGVGGAHAAGSLVPVQSKCIGADFRAPEGRFEFLSKVSGFFNKLRGEFAAPKPRCNSSNRVLASVNIALNLAKRDWPLGTGPVGMKDGVMRILPALVC